MRLPDNFTMVPNEDSQLLTSNIESNNNNIINQPDYG